MRLRQSDLGDKMMRRLISSALALIFYFNFITHSVRLYGLEPKKKVRLFGEGISYL